MIGLTALAIYLVGYLVAIPVIFRLMASDQFAQKNKNRGYGVDRLTAGDVIASAAGSSFLGLFWFFAVPFLTAYTVRNWRRLNFRREADRLSDDLEHECQLREQLDRARKELAQETTAEDVTKRALTRYRAGLDPGREPFAGN